MKTFKIAVNSGNGAAGPTFDALAYELSRLVSPLELIWVHHQPDHTFPNGISNPLLLANHTTTGNVVRSEGADFGVTFDCDFDWCFFLTPWASLSLADMSLDFIVYGPSVVLNTQNVISQKPSVALQSKTGEAFIEQSIWVN